MKKIKVIDTDLIIPDKKFNKCKRDKSKKIYQRICKRCNRLFLTQMGMKYSKICNECNTHPHRSTSMFKCKS